MKIIKFQMVPKMSTCHQPGKPAILTRELCDGIAKAIADKHEITEFLECFLMEISPEGADVVRDAVERAHKRLEGGGDDG